MPVSADPLVNDLSHPNDAGNPENQGQRNQHGHSQAHKADTSSPSVDLPVDGQAMDSLQEILAGDVRGQASGSRIRDRHEGHHVEPIQPGQHLLLERTERAVTVV